MVIEVALPLNVNDSTDICSNTKLSDLKYTDDVASLSEDPSKLQLFLHHPNDNAGMFEIHISFSTCKMLLQDCVG